MFIQWEFFFSSAHWIINLPFKFIWMYCWQDEYESCNIYWNIDIWKTLFQCNVSLKSFYLLWVIEIVHLKVKWYTQYCIINITFDMKYCFLWSISYSFYNITFNKFNIQIIQLKFNKEKKMFQYYKLKCALYNINGE